MKWASIDFEFNQSKEPNLNLVCCVIRFNRDGLHLVHKIWLHNVEMKRNNEIYLTIDQLHNQGYVFLAYAVTAEARSFLALNLEPLKYKWVDLYLEYRQLLNHNHKLMYGKQLMNGKVKYTKPPKNKWEQTEEEKKKDDNNKPHYGMASAVYKLLGIQIDTEFKTTTRDLIISNPAHFCSEEREQILQYCADDTEHLFPLFKAMVQEYKLLLGARFNLKQLFADMKVRAEFAVRTAKVESIGYPVNIDKMKNFSSQTGKILFTCQQDIIRQFPKNPPFYKFKKKEGTFTMNQSAIRDEIRKWLNTQPPKTKWMVTEGGISGKKDLSLSLGAFSKHFNFTHTYPKGHYFAQILRYLKLRQSLNGFMPSGKTSIWDYVGSDGKVRPYLGIYTAQSSRSQPKASSFIPLKSSWMRVMIEPPKGKCMISIDWASQEYLISALLSNDKNMLKAYSTGDVYMAFLKDCKAVPKTANKATHGKERVMAKPIILGQQYDLTEFGLAKQLTETTGIIHTPEMALKWINRHKNSYKTLWRWKAKIQRDYKLKRHLRLPDGWYLWGNNANFRSVGNVPSQGLAAAIMRKATGISQDYGLDISYQLHDALYSLEDIDKAIEKLKILATSMDQAFRFYFPEDMKKIAFCRLDGDIWSPELKEDNFKVEYPTEFGKKIMGTHQQSLYIDERGVDQYNQFEKYFKKERTDYKLMQF